MRSSVFGSYPDNTTNNRFHKPAHFRHHIPDDYTDFNQIQSGSGILDSIIQKGQLLNKVVKKADNFLTNTDAGTSLQNFVNTKANNNPNRRPKFKGERHIPVPTQYGYTLGNYIGPGTQLKKRIARGDKPVDPIFDKAALKHDIAYERAKTLKDVHIADDQFLKHIKKGAKKYPKLTQAITATFKAKKIGEKLSNKSFFADVQTGNGVNLAGSHLGNATANPVLANFMSQHGGKRKPALPGQKLKAKMIRKHRKSKNQHGKGLGKTLKKIGKLAGHACDVRQTLKGKGKRKRKPKRRIKKRAKTHKVRRRKHKGKGLPALVPLAVKSLPFISKAVASGAIGAATSRLFNKLF